MASLTIRNVRKVYPNGAEVLKGINLDIEDGQFIILVGGSGCGKSTLLNMIAGLETISEGEISIGDRVVNDIPPKSRDIAMVFQSYALYPTMTVRENISFGLGIRKVPKDEQKKIVDRVAETLQMTHLLDRKPALLSAASASAWPWAAPSRATRRCSCSMNRCRTWTPSCASKCAPKSNCCTSASAPPSSTSPTTRSKR